MQCEVAELALSALFDKESRGGRDLFLHLTTCRACRELLAQLFLLSAMGRVSARQWGRRFGEPG